MDKKSKTKSKTKGLKPNKESSTQLDVDLWEVQTKNCQLLLLLFLNIYLIDCQLSFSYRFSHLYVSKLT